MRSVRLSARGGDVVGEASSVGQFILGILVGIVIVIFVLVQCTRAIF